MKNEAQGRYPQASALVHGVYLRLVDVTKAEWQARAVLCDSGIDDAAHPDPVGALAHLQLGRAYVVSGDTAKAQKSYSDFLKLWTGADVDVPVLKQAKAEYARLR
jgi:hypothetical protein